jgi:hypothetical protein
MSIRWLEGFKRTPSDVATKFAGPHGEVVLVTSMGLRDGGDRAKMTKAYLDFGETELPRLSASKGKDVIKLRREDIAGNITLFSTAAVPDVDKNMFYLQFLAVSETGRCALFTVEGYGDPASELKRFRPLFDTIVWQSSETNG